MSANKINMTKYDKILITLLLAALCLAGCNVGLPPDVAKLGYVSRPHRFAMNVPPGWTVQESGGPAVVIVRAPERSGEVRPNVTVTVTPTPPGAALATVVAGAKQGVGAFRGFKQMSEDSRTLADGRPAHLLTFRQEAFGQPLVQRQLYAVAGDRVYTVTATASPETFASEEPNFETVFRSFRAGW